MTSAAWHIVVLNNMVSYGPLAQVACSKAPGSHPQCARSVLHYPLFSSGIYPCRQLAPSGTNSTGRRDVVMSGHDLSL